MIFLAYAAFVVLGLVCAFLQYWAKRIRRDPPIGNNPTFLQFQRGYFVAYFFAMMADWLQGPYLYKLYQHYGFMEDQIAVLYVCGFASTVLLGTWAPVAADRFGRKKLCVFFTVIYSLACFFKLSRSYGLLLIGRVLGGVATSLLFSAFEAWYVQEHLENDFPREWLPVTFNKATVWNGLLAVLAGVVANASAEWLGLGPVSPFMLAIPCLIASGVVVALTWKENYAKQQVGFVKSCGGGLRAIVTEPPIFLVGTVQALFESVMYVFVFLWTPVLGPARPPLGIVFAAFMVCIMIGSACFQILHTRGVPAPHLLCIAVVVALTGNLLCVLATHPDNMSRNLAFVAFLVEEVAVGLYFPAMSKVRTRVLPEASHASIVNWFRVPLNLIACLALMSLHSSVVRHGNRMLFVACVGLLALAGLSAFRFVKTVKHQEDGSDESNSQTNDSQA